MPVYKRVMVYGGTGTTGRAIAEVLADRLGLDVTIAGRNGDAAKAVAADLTLKLPERQFPSAGLDITDQMAVIEALGTIDLLIVSAPVAEHMDRIAEAALKSGTDMIDILVRPLAGEKVIAEAKAAKAAGRAFVTQAGFHPGMPGPLMRAVAPLFTRLDAVHVGMAMQVPLRDAQSATEIVSEVAEPAHLLDNGVWREASYKDLRRFSFGPPFGHKDCYPLDIPEVEAVARELGVKQAGTYAAGFNWFVDTLVFPLLIVAFRIGGSSLAHRVAPLFYYGNKWFSRKDAFIEIRAEATGDIRGHPATRSYCLSSREPYALTAQCVAAAVRQMIDGPLAEPGAWLMGEKIDHKRLFADLQAFGARVWEE
jgi:saccharopine dehydrogenase (NAD+, L-lysine-forming)